MSAWHSQALVLYRAKTSDTCIAGRLGVSRSAVQAWRQRNNLPGPRGTSKKRIICGAIEALAIRLYDCGKSDEQIADAISRTQECKQYTVKKWRHRTGRLTKRPSADNNPLFSDPVYSRASAAVGALAPDIRADMISDIYVAVLSGELAVDAIETHARTVTNRTLGMWTSKFGPISLDEVRADDGWNLHEAIPDRRATEAFRVVELSALAARLGMNVPAILETEDRP